MADKSRGKEDTYETLEDAIQKTRQRKLGEISRYKKRYNVDLADLENYDLVADTSFSNTEELAQIIIDGEKAYRDGAYYPKMWASPACFIGTQPGKETWSGSYGWGLTPEELAELMEKEGYNPRSGEIEILENYGEKFVKNGHHRCMAILVMGKTLTPYKIDKNEIANKYMEPAQNNLWYAYDWSDDISYYGGTIGKQKQFENFSIEKLTSYETRLKGMIEEEARKAQEER